jgi:hypothetical protein
MAIPPPSSEEWVGEANGGEGFHERPANHKRQKTTTKQKEPEIETLAPAGGERQNDINVLYIHHNRLLF